MTLITKNHENLKQQSDAEQLKLGEVVKLEGIVGYCVIVGLNPAPQLPVTVGTPSHLTDIVPDKISKTQYHHVDDVVLMLQRNNARKHLGWQTGKAGYYVEGERVIPVAFGRQEGEYHIAHEIDSKTPRAFRLMEADLCRVFDEKEEAEAYTLRAS
ncbi:hypothetical protein [Pontibacillus halophilus]|uniref:hypothetical protein n=1 Tax=Pontibacillus halophilus TaxID=516704 RepID=UPI0004046A1B|nr:hypothetical protein [Pontibacillus halophilus]